MDKLFDTNTTDTFGSELLEYLEIDIFEKYKIESPQFFICGKPDIKRRSEIIDWIDDNLIWKRWVKYKRKSKNLFELKDFFPDPSDEACYKIIDDFVKRVKGDNREVYFKFGFAIYNEKEIRKELLSSLREGYSEISWNRERVKDPRPNRDRIIYDVHLQENELDRRLTGGYLLLENKF